MFGLQSVKLENVNEPPWWRMTVWLTWTYLKIFSTIITFFLSPFLTSVYRPLKLKLPFLQRLHHSASRSTAGEGFILKVKAILGRLLNTAWLLSSDEFNGKHRCHESLNWSVLLEGMMEDMCSVYWTFSSSPHSSSPVGSSLCSGMLLKTNISIVFGAALSSLLSACTSQTQTQTHNRGRLRHSI